LYYHEVLRKVSSKHIDNILCLPSPIVTNMWNNSVWDAGNRGVYVHATDVQNVLIILFWQGVS